jgi:regulator of protease activity HflC (stomatin/prohibitin superfamily)
MKNITKYHKIGAVIVAVVLIFGFTFYLISPGEVGVKVNTIQGSTQSINPGWHFKRPFIDTVYTYNVRTQLWENRAIGASKDLQEISLELQINFRPIYEDVNKLHVEIGPDYIQRVLAPAIYESAKSAIAKYNAEEMLVQRDNLRALIEANLTNNLSEYHIAVISVNVKDIDFKPEFNKAVEEKMIEAQKVKTAEYIMEQARQKKAATILEAEGEAERQRLLTKSASKDSISLAWISKWDGVLPKTVAGGNSNFIVDLR